MDPVEFLREATGPKVVLDIAAFERRRETRRRRRRRLGTLGVVAATAALLAGILALDLNGDASSVEQVVAGSGEDGDPDGRPSSEVVPATVPAADFGRGCEAPEERPEDPEERREFLDRARVLHDAYLEEAEATGFMRTQVQNWITGEWVCGWSRYPALTGVDVALGAELFYEKPGGDVLGYMFGGPVFLTVEQVNDPEFDYQQRMINEFGCVVSLYNMDCVALAAAADSAGAEGSASSDRPR